MTVHCIAFLKQLPYHCASHTHAHPRSSIKIGTMSQTPAQILANLQTALPVIGAKISGGWANVQALSIKTNASVSLPIWNCSLEVGGEGEAGRFAEVKIAGEKEKKGEEKKRKREEAEADSKVRFFLSSRSQLQSPSLMFE